MNGSITEEQETVQTEVRIPIGSRALTGNLDLPAAVRGIVLINQGINRLRSGNQCLMQAFHAAGIGTLAFELLLPKEETLDMLTGLLRFNIDLMAARLISAAKWLKGQAATEHLPIGIFSDSTTAGAALVAAARMSSLIKVVVSRCGRPDLAYSHLPAVKAPTLLIVGGLDDIVVRLNQSAFGQLQCRKDLQILPGASHLFDESSRLDQITNLSIDWFQHYL